MTLWNSSLFVNAWIYYLAKYRKYICESYIYSALKTFDEFKNISSNSNWHVSCLISNNAIECKYIYVKKVWTTSFNYWNVS